MVRRTKAEAEKTKNALLTSAVVLFSERGVSKATLEDIATAAGVTKGAFYWHFKNKTEVLFAIRDRYLTLLERELFIQNLKKTNNISSILSVWSDFLKYSNIQTIYLDLKNHC
ncbi:TetR family transcriptional regulator [Shewanella dokdonensis]|uniref:TetR family transcriptional regulator n=1 Tax=Shewanella dokdonensis TaxID=712036 RepID=A0ABX8DH92_9GAMM|nr:TetR family transcriptional regulator [Shewanella dokdonensis]QVK24128.1 TetR family transcriptional regulator [Shewanella dokdonensis]